MWLNHRRARSTFTLLGALVGAAAFSLFVLIWLPWRVPDAGSPSQIRSLARADPSFDSCAACHRRVTPGIVDQWSESLHGLRGVTCRSCHEVKSDNPYAIEHVGTHVSTTVTPAICAECHPAATEEFQRSRHSLPAWASLNGTVDFEHDEDLMALWAQCEVYPDPDENLVLSRRSTLFEIQGEEISTLACVRCHEIGRPNLDGSAGSCSKCHLRHRFNLEQVRRPETCNTCHVGEDQPQWGIFTESSHGVIYQTQTELYHFDQVPGRLSVDDFPAPTCQLCHMSGFGSLSTTHDVGERLAWSLNQPIAQRREGHEKRRAAMREVCRQCHSTDFITNEFTEGDRVVEWTNERVAEANDTLRGLMEENLISKGEFNHPLHHLTFDLWHYSARTARFGALMQGPDHTQWQGIYPLLRALSDLESAAASLRAEQSNAAAEEITGGE
jgi:hypothetical protein